MKRYSLSARITSFAIVLFLLVPLLGTASIAYSSLQPNLTLNGWDIYTEDNGNDNAGYEWVNYGFEAFADENSHLSVISPGTKYNALGWNEGAKILAVAKNELYLGDMKINLDISKAQFPCNKSALSVGILSDNTVSSMPANNSECLKGLGAIGTNENDIAVTLNQIVLNTQTILNKATIYVGGIEITSAILNWIVSTENTDLEISFDAVGAGTMGTIIYECSIKAETHSGATGESEGVTIQKLKFSAPNVLGYPAVFSGSYGDNTYAYPDFTIKSISRGNETVSAADFYGYYTASFTVDDSKPEELYNPYYYYNESHLVGYPVNLPMLDNYTNEEKGIISTFDGWYYSGKNIGTQGSYSFTEPGYHNLVGKWKTDYIKQEYNPSVSTYGVTVTVNGLEGVKDFFIAKGKYLSYRELKYAAKTYLSVTSAKFSDDYSYTYGAAIGTAGEYTICLRYEDSSIKDKILYFNCDVTYPKIKTNGRQLSISSLDDVKTVRIARGHYTTAREVKNGYNARGYSAKEISKLIDENGVLTLQNFADTWGVEYTVYIEYNNKYSEIHNVVLYQKSPFVIFNGKTATFSNLDGMTRFRYAPGEFTTANEIKNAHGTKYISPDKVVDDTIKLSGFNGKYTFLVQYDDNSQNIFTLDFQ